MWKRGLEATSSEAPVPLVRTSWPPGLDRRRIKAAGRWGREISPSAAAPNGNAAGSLAPMFRVWGHAGWKVFRKLVLGIAGGLWAAR